MASEIQYRGAVSATTYGLYVTIREATPRYWNTTGDTLETLFASSHPWTQYTGTALTETPAVSYFYTGTFPAGLAAGWYSVDIFQQIGATAAITDPILATMYGYWNGTVFQTRAADVEQWKAATPIALPANWSWSTYAGGLTLTDLCYAFGVPYGVAVSGSSPVPNSLILPNNIDGSGNPVFLGAGGLSLSYTVGAWTLTYGGNTWIGSSTATTVAGSYAKVGSGNAATILPLAVPLPPNGGMPETLKTSYLPNATAGTKGGLPITDTSTGLLLTGFGGANLEVLSATEQTWLANASNVTNNQKRSSFVVPGQMLIPATGTQTYTIQLTTKNENGAAEAPTSSGPTITCLDPTTGYTPVGMSLGSVFGSNPCTVVLTINGLDQGTPAVPGTQAIWRAAWANTLVPTGTESLSDDATTIFSDVITENAIAAVAKAVGATSSASTTIPAGAPSGLPLNDASGKVMVVTVVLVDSYDAGGNIITFQPVPPPGDYSGCAAVLLDGASAGWSSLCTGQDGLECSLLDVPPTSPAHGDRVVLIPSISGTTLATSTQAASILANQTSQQVAQSNLLNALVLSVCAIGPNPSRTTLSVVLDPAPVAGDIFVITAANPSLGVYQRGVVVSYTSGTLTCQELDSSPSQGQFVFILTSAFTPQDRATILANTAPLASGTVGSVLGTSPYQGFTPTSVTGTIPASGIINVSGLQLAFRFADGNIFFLAQPATLPAGAWKILNAATQIPVQADLRQIRGADLSDENVPGDFAAGASKMLYELSPSGNGIVPTATDSDLAAGLYGVNPGSYLSVAGSSPVPAGSYYNAGYLSDGLPTFEDKTADVIAFNEDGYATLTNGTVVWTNGTAGTFIGTYVAVGKPNATVTSVDLATTASVKAAIAAGVDPHTLRDAMALALTNGTTVEPGSVDAELLAQSAGLADVVDVVTNPAGNGIVPHPFIVTLSNGQPLYNCAVRVYIDAEMTTQAAGTGTLFTDQTGIVTFMLSAGTYYFYQELAGVTFTPNPVEETVS